MCSSYDPVRVRVRGSPTKDSALAARRPAVTPGILEDAMHCQGTAMPSHRMLAFAALVGGAAAVLAGPASAQEMKTVAVTAIVELRGWPQPQVRVRERPGQSGHGGADRA
jgi:hypothetical protein